jgi:hypothetical protein
MVTLVRNISDEAGTYGVITCPSGLSFVTLELVWNNNIPFASCIPTGIYKVKWTKHPIHGWVFQIMDVPNRSDCLIHSANIPIQLKGCVALGKAIAIFNPGSFPGIDVPVKGINHSKEALTEFESEMLATDFELEIKNSEVLVG